MSSQASKYVYSSPERQLYLLKLSRNKAQTKWSITLQSHISAPPKLFANLDELYDFLKEVIDS